MWNRGAEIAQLGCALDDLGVRILAGARYLRFFQNIRISSRAQSASYSMGTEGFFPKVVKRSEREADHSPPSDAEVENE